jgi:microtubule-associated protein-like 6|uniref:Guanine nucleotide-binding protein subunit beta-like protein n=1 Tax=Eutreptiella gymnastica TaxID=73025 RepID=A0A7S4LG85_9EUGL
MAEIDVLTQHVIKQEELISQLKSVVDQQALALQILKEEDDDLLLDDGEGAGDAAGYESGDEEFDRVGALSHAAMQKEDEPPIDATEKGEKDVDFDAEPTEEERNFMSVKPWLGAMCPPTDFKKDPALDEAPSVKLELEHVYGYRARTCRNNVYWIDDNTIVYFAAAVGIVHKISNNTQQFFFGHSDDIVSLDYHKKRGLVATGQLGKDPKICVWDVYSMEQVHCFSGYHQRAVVDVSFSADGSRLASVGLDDDHSVAVYNIDSGAMVAEAKGGDRRILSVCWNTCRDANGNTDFITVGRKHIQFWQLEGTRLEYKKGILGRKGEIQTFLTAACTSDGAVVGTQDGSMYFFRRNKLRRIVQAHNGMIYSLKFEGQMLFSGGRDGLLTMWSPNGSKVASFDLNKYDSGESKNSVRAIDFLDNKIVAGTITSTIYGIDLSTNEVSVLQVGHFGNLKTRDPHEYGELWGLCPVPKELSFASVCEDGTLRVWDVQQRRMVKRVEIGSAALCCHMSSDGALLAVGFSNGAFAIYDTSDYTEILRKRHHKRRVPCIKFSPDCTMLAVASAQNVIDLYDATRGFRRVGVCAGHSSAVLHLDWDKASQYIQTVSQAYELLWYDKKGMQEPNSRRLKDLQYATQECTLGWNVQGIWPKFSDGSDINMVNLSNNEKYLVSCEDSGKVKIFNYPCIGSGLDRRGKLRRRPESQIARGHSSHVTNAAFLHNDSYVISTGGADLCSFQWKVVPAN